ncbi:hypothetical protein NKI09_04870 [Mesorhizobium sp. M0757]|uniref:hypothetical protein n=1 Tax=Mesorhizobium sp. M0757 TaxID=2956993 RepID=UPI0033399A14
MEQKIKENSGFLSWLTGVFGSGAIGLGWLNGMVARRSWPAGRAAGLPPHFAPVRSRIVAAVRQIKAEVAE